MKMSDGIWIIVHMENGSSFEARSDQARLLDRALLGLDVVARVESLVGTVLVLKSEEIIGYERITPESRKRVWELDRARQEEWEEYQKPEWLRGVSSSADPCPS